MSGTMVRDSGFMHANLNKKLTRSFVRHKSEQNVLVSPSQCQYILRQVACNKQSHFMNHQILRTNIKTNFDLNIHDEKAYHKSYSICRVFDKNWHLPEFQRILCWKSTLTLS